MAAADLADGRAPVSPAGFEVVEHMADWALRVRGADFAQFLVHAAQGMNSLLVNDPAGVPLTEERQFTLEAFDQESMLVEWLSELAYYAEREGLIFTQFELLEATPERLQAVVRGGYVAELQKHVKAVTYHNLVVTESATGLEATVVLDV